jgi:hypothetical protein
VLPLKVQRGLVVGIGPARRELAISLVGARIGWVILG